MLFPYQMVPHICTPSFTVFSLSDKKYCHRRENAKDQILPEGRSNPIPSDPDMEVVMVIKELYSGVEWQNPTLQQVREPDATAAGPPVGGKFEWTQFPWTSKGSGRGSHCPVDPP
jgi:hypothetical protein